MLDELGTEKLEADRCSDQLLRTYDLSLRRQGRSLGTRRKYLPVVHDFLGWVGGRELGALSTADVDQYLAAWEAQHERHAGRPPRRATARGRVAALRSLFSYAERSGMLVDAEGAPARNPMLGVVAPAAEQRRNDFLRPLEDQALLACQCSPAERVVIVLLRWTGLRVSEACSLKLADVDLTPGSESITVTRSKTRAGVRTLPLVPQLVPEVEAWLEVLRTRGLTAPSTPFLATAHGTAMAPTYIWRIVKRVAARAGVRPVACSCGSRRRTRHQAGCACTCNGEHVSQVSPHTLRRTFGSHLLNAGLRLEVVSRLLGHSNSAVTERAYAQLLGATIRKELLAVLADAV